MCDQLPPTPPAKGSSPKTEPDVSERLNELSKSLESLTNRQKDLEVASNRVNSKLRQMAEEQANARFCVIGIYTVLLAILAASVIVCPVGSGQASVLCCVVIFGSLLGVMYFVTCRRKDENEDE